MMRVKLVIIRMSDGKTVKRLIRTRICRLSESGRPSPETSASALVSAPELSGAAACAKAGPAWKTARPTAMANPAQMIWRDLRFIVAFRDLVDAPACYRQQQALAFEPHHGELAERAPGHRINELDRAILLFADHPRLIFAPQPQRSAGHTAYERQPAQKLNVIPKHKPTRSTPPIPPPDH